MKQRVMKVRPEYVKYAASIVGRDSRPPIARVEWIGVWHSEKSDNYAR
jgi:hypothetical protein